MVRSSLQGAALALGAVVAAAGCAPLVDTQQVSGEERSVVKAPTRPGEELVIGLDAEPDALDPTLATTLVGRQVFASMCEKLYDVDADLDLVPQLAAGAPKVSDDGLRVTIPLRDDGVRFNDGTAFTAQAVERSLERHLELPGSVRATELAAVESVRTKGDSAVELKLSRPYAPLQAILADRAGMIMSPAQLDKLGSDFARDPVCVGPYTFVERVAQDRIVLKKSEHYYAKDRVLFDRLVYKGIPDDTIRLANLRSGQLDVMSSVGPDDVATVANESGIHLLNQPSMQYMGITVNVANANGVGEEPSRPDTPLATEPKLREALSLALDRETLNEVAFSGLYRPACGPIPPVSEFATKATLACPDTDLDRARKLVAETGASTPVPVELMIPNDPLNLRIGQVIQAMAAKAGFDVQLRSTEFASSIAEAQAGNFDAYVQGWSGRADPHGNIGQFHVKGGGNNYSGHSTPETDDLIRRAAAETDTDRRKQLYNALVPKLQEANSIIYLYRSQVYVAHSDDVAGVRVYPDGLMRVTNAGLVADEGE